MAWLRSPLPSSFEFLVYAICLVAWGMVLIPVVVYLATLWRTRRENLTSVLNDHVLRLYFKQFHPAETCTRTGHPKEEFRRMFHGRYGRQHYAIPYSLLFILTTFAAYAAKDTLLVWGKAAAPAQVFPLQPIVASALAGAFLWIIYDQLDRIRKRDVTPHELYGYTLRILAAAPFGWAFAQLMKNDFGVPLAFVLGAFPTRQLFKAARRIGEQKLSLADEPENKKGELERLQCIGKPAAERFAQENVETIVDLAYKDPIDLTIRTNFDLNYVVDCVSQALLWMYFENDIKEKKFYELSLRGAQETADLLNDYEGIQSPDCDPRQVKAMHVDAEQAIRELSSLAGVSDHSLRVALRQVARDPYTKFLRALWKSMHVLEVPETPQQQKDVPVFYLNIKRGEPQGQAK